MLEVYVRPIYQTWFVNPVAKILQGRFSAHTITLSACLIGILVLPALLLGMNRLAVLFLLTSGYLDTLDGTVARMTNTTSSQGSVFDIISDRLVELAVILGLYALDTTHRGLLSLLMLGSCYICITSFLVVGIFTANNSDKGFHYSPGIIERAEAFIFFSAMILLPNYFSVLAMFFTSLVLLTSYLHIKQFIKLSPNFF